MNSKLLEQIEEITRTMQDTVAREDWDRLAEQERQRITLARTIDPDEIHTPANQAILSRVVRDNALLVKRVSECRADIALLLDGMTGKPGPAR